MTKHRNRGWLFLPMLIIAMIQASVMAFEFPAVGWHRGDVSFAQENSKRAILKSLESPMPHIEVDIIDFIDSNGTRVGLLAHETKMARTTGQKGRFDQHHVVSQLPHNIVDPTHTPDPFMTVIELFDIIQAQKKLGINLIVSLDMKEDGKTGEAFGQWIGTLIQKYQFQDTMFTSSLYKSNIVGVESTCPECLTGGQVFQDHFALKYLDPHYTSLDISGCNWTFFLGFLCKENFTHDLVILQDDVFFTDPAIIDFWKAQRQVKFVGVFVYNKDRPYTHQEKALLEKVDWIELDKVQMTPYLDDIREGGLH